jgi:hypothetical protein
VAFTNDNTIAAGARMPGTREVARAMGARLALRKALLPTEHWHAIISEMMGTIWTDIEAIISIVQVNNWEMQIADTTTSCIWLTSDLTITFKKFLQCLNHILEIETIGIRPFHSRRTEGRKSSCRVGGRHLTSMSKSAAVV